MADQDVQEAPAIEAAETGDAILVPIGFGLTQSKDDTGSVGIIRRGERWVQVTSEEFDVWRHSRFEASRAALTNWVSDTGRGEGHHLVEDLIARGLLIAWPTEDGGMADAICDLYPIAHGVAGKAQIDDGVTMYSESNLPVVNFGQAFFSFFGQCNGRLTVRQIVAALASVSRDPESEYWKMLRRAIPTIVASAVLTLE